jgi:hypothetical protein
MIDSPDNIFIWLWRFQGATSYLASKRISRNEICEPLHFPDIFIVSWKFLYFKNRKTISAHKLKEWNFGRRRMVFSIQWTCILELHTTQQFKHSTTNMKNQKLKKWEKNDDPLRQKFNLKHTCSVTCSHFSCTVVSRRPEPCSSLAM